MPVSLKSSLCLLTLLAVPLASAAAGTMPVGADRIDIEVSGDLVAVFIDAQVEVDGVVKRLAEPGLGAAQLEPSSVPGWFYVDVSGLAADDGRDTLVDRLVREGRVDFASDVYLAGTMSLPWTPTRDIIIGFEPGCTEEASRAFIDAELGGVVVQESLGGLPGVWLVQTELATGRQVLDTVNRLSGRGVVRYAQPDAITIHKRAWMPNDPLFSSQWALDQASDVDMDAPEAWDVTIGDESVVVVVLDDGAQQGHPDLHQLPGGTFTGSSSDGEHSTPCDGHGTMVSSCISSTIDNNLDLVGVAPGCYTRGGKIFNAIDFFGFCFGFLESQDSWIVAGLEWSVDIGARITNSSWGGGASSAVVVNAFANSRSQGVLHFAAAGNDGSSTIGFPANLPTVNAVTAIASNGSLASFSTFGSGAFVTAPGASVLVADRTGSAGFGSGDTINTDGTSFASPYAAGVAALIITMDASLGVEEVEEIMMNHSVDAGPAGYDTQYGYGIVNANEAVLAVDVETPCDGDVDGSGFIGVDDLLRVVAAWGACSACDEDITGDGSVGVDDLLVVISAWGDCS